MSHHTIPLESTIAAEFSRAVQRHSASSAIGSGSWQPTYAELLTRADSLAAVLRSGCSAGSRIAILGRLDGPLVGSLLGAWRAGCVAAVLNPGDSVARLQASLATLDAAVIVTHRDSLALAREVANQNASVVCFEDCATSTERVDSCSGASDLAVLIQTSGSMGEPKWVMQSNENLLLQTIRHNSVMRVTQTDRVLLLASPSGSQAIATILTALLHGATLCPFPAAERGILGLAPWMHEHRVTVYVSAASAFRAFVQCLRADDQFADVRVVKLGAEAIRECDVIAAMRHFPNYQTIYCSYSSAEMGTVAQFELAAGQQLPIGGVQLGEAADDAEIFLVTERGDPAEQGEIGEIVVQGKYLSPGYWRDEQRTREQFFDVGLNMRGYRTGDLARRDEYGRLWFAGRRDRGAKIRGTRVDLDAVEAATRQASGVSDAVACERSRADGSSVVCAFVVAPHSSDPQIREDLARMLPKAAIPNELVFLDQFPLTAHGKVDRQALLALPRTDSTANTQAILSTPTESVLAEVWKQVFGNTPSDGTARIFSTGGDSLTLAVFAARVQDRFGVELQMEDFTEASTLSRLAARILEIDSLSNALPPLRPVPEGTIGPLSFAQEAIWDACQKSEKARAGYVMARYVELRGSLDIAALRSSIAELVARHDILRTNYRSMDGHAAAIVQAVDSIEVPFADVSTDPNPPSRAAVWFAAEASRPIDLAQGPPVRFSLIRLTPSVHWLVRVNHHMIGDGWSWVVFFRELAASYGRNRITGIAQQPAKPSLQYRDYAAWERRVFAPESEARAKMMPWWKDTLSQHLAPVDLPFRKTFNFGRKTRPGDGLLRCDLERTIRYRFAEFAKQHNVTHSAIGAALFSAQLATAMDRGSVMIGVHITNRRSAALQDMLGDFANLAPLCLTLDASLSFEQWIVRVQKCLGETQAHALLPREQVWADLHAQGMTIPEIEAIFIGSNPKFPGRLGDLEMARPAYPTRTMPWGFTLNLDIDDTERGCEITFDANRYSRRKVNRFAERYLQLLDTALRRPESRMCELLQA
ncbi:MAG: condensation domain-containing protein [Bryobacteraceae bacterium]